jgi:hypothetical protein
MRRILLFLLIAFALLTGGAVPASAQDPAGTVYGHVANCYAKSNKLAVLALIDQSSSLHRTDPGARRVDALTGMLDNLARYGSMGETGDRRIQVQLAGFGTGFYPQPWQEINQQTGPALKAEARNFATRDNDNDTDFAMALAGAQSQFRELDAREGGQVCRLLLLFTDGMYELGSANVDRPYAAGVGKGDLRGIVGRGQHFLCDSGGLVDQLRSADTATVAIGLFPARPDGRPDGKVDQSFLQSLAERDAPGQHCGDSTTPPGKYLAATSLIELLRAFDKAILEALNGTPADGPQQVPVCAPTAPTDARCARQFTLDPSLREFHLLLNLGAPGVVARIEPPRGGGADLQPGRTFELAGAGLAVVTLADRDLVADGTLPPGRTDWVGTWTVRFVDTTGQNANAVGQSQITVFGGLVPVADPAPPKVQAGEPTDFAIRITDAAGSPRTPADFVRSTTVTAVLADAQGAETRLAVGPVQPDGSYRVHHDVPVGIQSQFVDLTLTLDVTTTGGLRLRPRSTGYRIPVQQPSAYPTVGPLELKLSPIVDEGTANGTLTVTGGPGGTGCAWFGPADFRQAPRDTGKLASTYQPDATSEGQCVRVAPGEHKTVAVAVSAETVRSGLAAGRIPVTLTGGTGPARQVVVPVRFEMEHVPGAKTQLLFTLLVCTGWLLPFLVLWLANRLTARFAEPGLLRYRQLDVVITPGTVHTENGRRLHEVLDQRIFGPMTGLAGGNRRFTIDGLSFRARVPVPWILPYGVVRAGGKPVLASGGSLRGKGKARVGFELNTTWVLAIDETAQPMTAEDFRVTGKLSLFVTDFRVAEKVTQLLAEVERDLPERVAAVAERLYREKSEIPEPSVGVYVPRA